MKMKGYIDYLQDILQFSEGRRYLHISEVAKYTGLCERTLRALPFRGEVIQASILAMELSRRGKKR